MNEQVPITIEQSRFTLSFDPCAYCGVATAANREDPIPRAIYPVSERRRTNLLKIPACRDCNEHKSVFDGSLRDYLVMHRRSSEHPLVQEMLDDKFRRAVERNRVPLLDRFVQGQDVDFVPEAGVWVDGGYAFPADLELVREAVRWMARGLHWAAFKQSVKHQDSDARFVSDDYLAKSIEVFRQGGFDGVYRQGTPFTCGWSVSSTGRVVWAFVFFGRELMIGSTQVASGKTG